MVRSICFTGHRHIVRAPCIDFQPIVAKEYF